MLISQPLPFVHAFVDEINAALKAHNPACEGLSAIQRRWLSFCLMAIMLTQSVCWARFERAGWAATPRRRCHGCFAKFRPCGNSRRINQALPWP